jgi:hypothetical protein
MTRSLKRPYTGPKAVSGSCRGRDGCPVCVGNRTAKHERQTVDAIPALVAEVEPPEPFNPWDYPDLDWDT